MAIPIECECGKRFRAKDQDVGKRGKCPVCGRTLVIGQPTRPRAAASNGPNPDGDRTVQFLSSLAAQELATTSRRPRTSTVPPQTIGLGQVQRARGTIGDSDSPVTREVDSPLSEEALHALNVTEQFRRRIRHAAIWFRLQFLLGLVFTVFLAIVGIYGIATATPSSAAGAGFLILLFQLAIQFGVLVFWYLAHKATWACQRWAPMTVLILHGGVAAFCIAVGFIGAISPRGNTMFLVAGIAVAIVPGIIAILCYRAWDAIPKFLERPAWCRQALIHCGL